MTAGKDHQAEAFWQVIDSTRAESHGDLERQTELIEERLSGSEPGEIIAFQEQLDNAMNEANTWDLWAAAYIINGGASDDGFEYFRGWLVMQGQQVFYDAVADAESLTDYPGVEPYSTEWENILYLPHRVYEEKVGQPMALSRTFVNTRGKSWEEDELEERYPRLWSVYGEA